jgi:hypothetical protein
MVRYRLRMLTVDGRQYTWTAEIRDLRGSLECHRCIRVRVWGNGKNGQALQTDLLSASWPPGPYGVCATDSVYPGPGDIRRVIEAGLRSGWQPGAVGGTFILSERMPAPTFEDDRFLITDRRHDETAADPSERVVAAYDQRRVSA